MKKLYEILITSIVSSLIVFGVFFYVWNYVSFGSLSFLNINGEPLIGTTLTDMQSTDTMSDFPTLYNANNLALNNGKIEVSSTSIASITTLSNLVSIGTITTGVWNGTAIGVAYNGTGTTSPTSNMVMLGNGSSGFKVVVGFGTSGQFLTSNGAGNAPTWQTSAVNLSDYYNWTGGHYFNASTTLNATTTILNNSLTNNALIIRGLSYLFPSAHNASSSVLMNDGSGSLSWNKVPEVLATATLSSDNSSISTGTFAAASELEILVEIASSTADASIRMTFNGDGGSNYGYRISTNGEADSAQNHLTYLQLDTGTTSARFLRAECMNKLNTPKNCVSQFLAGGGSYAPVKTEGGGTWNNTTAQITSVSVAASAGNFVAGSRIVVRGRKD